MPTFFALVDALAGRERDVHAALQGMSRLTGVQPCREGNYDFLVRFEADAFGVVDDFLQTHVRGLPGVKGVQVVVDWEDVGSAAREARARLG